MLTMRLLTASLQGSPTENSFRRRAKIPSSRGSAAACARGSMKCAGPSNYSRRTSGVKYAKPGAHEHRLPVETSISLLEKWYLQRCNGDWEHSWGIKIQTLDNPGWRLKINLNETSAENRVLERTKINRGENDWIMYWVEKKVFHAPCGPLNLSETIKVFIAWFES